MKDRCVILGGAPIQDYGRLKAALGPADYIICCDSGLTHAPALGVTPDLILGDFDSHPRPDTGREIITLPREKDDTDTVYAVKAALDRGFCSFLLAGVTGGRMDHTLVNLYLLQLLEQAGAHGVILDDCSEMELVSAGPAYIPDRYPYFSLLAILGPAAGVTVKNAKYPLDRGAIHPAWQYAVSNEPLPGQTATVTVESGTLLLIRDF